MENLKAAIVFAILMEKGEGILGKSQDYVLEKLRNVHVQNPEMMLNPANLTKLREWERRWKTTR